MRGLSTNEGDVEDDAAAAKKYVILCVNTEIFVQASFNSLFQLLIVSSRSTRQRDDPCIRVDIEGLRDSRATRGPVTGPSVNDDN